MPTQEFFTPVAFDFLWEELGAGELPYPLKVASHGRTESERMALRRQAENEFEARGIVGSPVEGWLDVLGRARTSVDALFIPEFQHPPVGAIAASDGKQAVLAVQDGQGVRLQPIYPDGLASAVVDLLPAAQRGTSPSITLPMGEALQTRPDRTGALAGRTGNDSGESGGRRRGSLTEQASDPREAYAQLIAQPRLRGGQLAANSRDELGYKKRSAVLAWFDTATGRYLSTSGADSDWVTVAPADTKTLRTRLAELVAGVAN
ncbi:hypothetical protein BJF85_12695 [Saccharomonospora sp. CUA-673]|uniref:ESX secretion-associated protein EspG n=1 Tax=Saccharomonospora sp. CUA-673 TaxID=1904969 RepID=UPI0009675AC3|nr:ESX secretion-associated protein EspG [Saccharomonospora sp. CUA-673]OLT48434.1 hypothetical protein BJF85_12695 [Saccharomonospora sp. CUA-673]